MPHGLHPDEDGGKIRLSPQHEGIEVAEAGRDAAQSSVPFWFHLTVEHAEELLKELDDPERKTQETGFWGLHPDQWLLSLTRAAAKDLADELRKLLDDLAPPA